MADDLRCKFVFYDHVCPATVAGQGIPYRGYQVFPQVVLCYGIWNGSTVIAQIDLQGFGTNARNQHRGSYKSLTIFIEGYVEIFAGEVPVFNHGYLEFARILVAIAVDRRKTHVVDAGLEGLANVFPLKLNDIRQVWGKT